MRHLLELRQSLMSRVQDNISNWRGLSWKDLSKGVSIDFLLALLFLALFTYLVWGFDYVDELYDRLVVSLLTAALPLLAFFEAMHQERESRRFSWWNVGVTFFLGLFVLMAFSQKSDHDALGGIAIVTMASSPWLFIFGMLVRRKRILAIGMVPAAIILMAYWVVPELSNDLELHYLLGPLPAVSFTTAGWTFLVWILFKGVDRWPTHPTLGPLMESLAMLFLFIPLMVLAIWVPRTIPGGADLSVVIATMVGVLFGSVVSDPLRRFLRSYGNLPSHRRCDGSNEVEQGQDSA